MKYILCLIATIVSFSGFTQPLNQVNLNDTSMKRIYNGIIISKDFRINQFDRIKKVGNTEDLESLGFDPSEPILIIEHEMYDIEYKIDSVLYSQADFISSYKFPLSIQLPLAINKKLLNHDEKKEILPKLTLNRIKKIEYIDHRKSMNKNGISPFGMINLVF